MFRIEVQGNSHLLHVNFTVPRVDFQFEKLTSDRRGDRRQGKGAARAWGVVHALPSNDRENLSTFVPSSL